jgi:hypothetical protein
MSLEHPPAQDGKSEPAAVECEFLDEYEAAALLNVGVYALRRWRLERTGPEWLKMSKYVRYRRGVLLAWAAAQAQPTKAA